MIGKNRKKTRNLTPIMNRLLDYQKNRSDLLFPEIPINEEFPKQSIKINNSEDV